MAAIKVCAMGMVALGLSGAVARAADPVALRETARAGEVTRVTVTLKAQGFYRPAAVPGGGREASPKPLALRVETRLELAERVLNVDEQGRPSRTARRVERAGSAVNGEVRPMAVALRPGVALLVAEPGAEGVVVFSPDGPLTRSELELVQGPGDPLSLGGLLPAEPVAVGGRWKVSDATARALSAYDTLASNGLGATLEAVSEATATVRIQGDVRGSVLGGEGTMACAGTLTFDRKENRLARLSLDRAEARSPGPVEAGLDVKSTLTVERRSSETPVGPSDAVVARLSGGPASAPLDPARLRLRLDAPDGRYTLLHDRDWHTYWDDPRLTVLKRLERGEVVAQCNLAAGPSAGKGRHQDLGRFRDDVKLGLGERFVQWLGAGEVDGEAAGNFRYKLGVQGRQGDVGVLWYYYLVASPEGDQVVATFTLADTHRKAFGNEDERLMGTFRWTPGEAVAGAAGAGSPR